MIQRKKKLCKGCNTPQYLYGHQLCNTCYKKKKAEEYKKKEKPPRKPINKVSEKKKAELNEYTKKRADFLRLHPSCAGNGIIPGCNFDERLTIHHLRGREGEKMLDEDNWMTLCMACHIFVHENSLWSYENGFLKSKHQVEGYEE